MTLGRLQHSKQYILHDFPSEELLWIFVADRVYNFSDSSDLSFCVSNIFLVCIKVLCEKYCLLILEQYSIISIVAKIC